MSISPTVTLYLFQQLWKYRKTMKYHILWGSFVFVCFISVCSFVDPLATSYETWNTKALCREPADAACANLGVARAALRSAEVILTYVNLSEPVDDLLVFLLLFANFFQMFCYI